MGLLDRFSRTFDKYGYDLDGYKKNGYDKKGYDKNGRRWVQNQSFLIFFKNKLNL